MTPWRPAASPDPEAARRALPELTTVGGLDHQQAECVLDSFSDAGLSMVDSEAIARGATAADPSTAPGGGTDLRDCLDDEALRPFIATGLEVAPPSVLRQSFITAFLTQAPTSTTRVQAGCVFDALLASEINLADLLITEPSAEAEATLASSFRVCAIT